jgi:peptidoglycan hydrolase-like protein with peptidoglycan-binding domain
VARCPFARWTPVNFTAKLDRMSGQPRAVFLHTNGGGSNLVPWFNHLYASGQGRIGSTFQIYRDGRIDQLCDTQSVIYAQYSASQFAVSVETEDDGHPDTPWTSQQLAAIIRLIRWLHDTHGVPLRAMTSPTDSGVSYHQQFHVYNQTSHNCPGSVRVAQLHNTVLPALAMAPTPTPTPQPKPKPKPTPAPTHVPPFPLRVGDWFGPPSVNTHNHSGYFSASDRTRFAPWQRQMVNRGWKLTVSGRVDGATETAIKSFQSEKGLKVDGRVGPLTWARAWTSSIT